VSQKPIRVLVIDDEPQIRRFLRTSLGAHDYEVIDAETGEEGLRRASTDHPDVIIVDLGLPDVEGIDLVRNIRGWSQVPIIVLSVRAREEDKIEALDRGADDYVTKPFGMGELLARIRAALRHKLQKAGEMPVYRSGGISLDLVKRHVLRDGVEVKLSPREYELLRVLVQHAGRVVTHQHLLREVWGPAQVHETQYLRVYVGQIRQKLEADVSRPTLIQTEAGVGYRLAEPDQ
jgi:two-component system, OmpR family, KDP operon response regulator KdpE